MIKAVIFDFDGLIMDTESEHYEALCEIFRGYNCEMPLELWGKGVGTHSGFKPFKYLEEQIKKPLDTEKLDHELEEMFLKRLEKGAAREGVEDYLKSAKNLGLKVGLASSSDRKWLHRYLRQLGLLAYFDCIKSSDDVEKVKPDPALYLKAAGCLGVEPEQCLVFEDSPNGSLAAKRAGMACVVVPNRVTKDLKFGEIDHRLGSMAETPLEEVIRFIESR
ncbi:MULTISPECIES: HAD family hydrolase [Heyndrickxia]|jgi:HAD superfamily hydrolase (TIGR01509 family)|uniref:HAD hydrolase, family IA, variant 3 n=2 Tax=Heyndrickxia TaxID=2837504 RepID=A0A150JTR1_HEYCO|nr:MULTISPECIES: HAD family hydrolase [Heyndrickxia]NWN95568.1 HAD family hydrolase [Bacillus sp. (in: firmicutes)]KGT38662.1 hypothetical protein P421_08695 [Heyndrickxia coagulans P38]KWZ82715.1 HAD hydrolase, family IA, variant 3 [Heyndrickxia coagulans]KYC60690.1 hypothetical protein B4100_0734 [Heyndrickxia coagulans]KYC77240.1 hypothetical protein B4096_0688 [Heyndrickxia coagulans]